MIEGIRNQISKYLANIIDETITKAIAERIGDVPIPFDRLSWVETQNVPVLHLDGKPLISYAIRTETPVSQLTGTHYNAEVRFTHYG